MTTGFLIGAFLWALWWNIDWQRFIKFYLPSGPPYSRWAEVVFRTFFAACAFGEGAELVKGLFQGGPEPGFYRNVTGFGVIWFAVIVLMVRTVEWLNSKRIRRS